MGVPSRDHGTILIGSRLPVSARLWDATTLRPIGTPIICHEFMSPVALAPDGKRILAATLGNSARLWDALTSQLIGQPMWHQNPVKAVSFSPDGKTIVTGSDDKTARLWDAGTTQTIGRPMAHDGAVNSVAFSPDGKTVLTGSDDKTARLWDASTGLRIGPPMQHQACVTRVMFSPDGNTLLTRSGDAAQLWHFATGEPFGRPLKHRDTVLSMAFAPDGKSVLTGGGDNTARLWNATTGEPLGPALQHKGPVTRVLYSPDGGTVVTGSDDKTTRMWDAATAQPIGFPLQHDSSVRSLAYWPAANSLLTVTTGIDTTTRLWRLPATVDDDLPRILAWVQTITGLGLDDQGVIFPLDSVAWHQQRNRLRQLGGPPKADSACLRDPILYGRHPTARAGSWADRMQWDKAEAAFNEAVLARPFSEEVWLERGEFHDLHKRQDEASADFARAFALRGQNIRFLSYWDRPKLDKMADGVLARLPGGASGLSTGLLLSRARRFASDGEWDVAQAALLRAGDLPRGIPQDSTLLEQRGDVFALMGRWDQAAADYGEVAHRWPEEYANSRRQMLSLLAAGDQAGSRRAVSDLLERFGRTTEPRAAYNIAWACVVAPGPLADSDTLIGLADLALKKEDGSANRHFVPNVLGAALYRVGRFEDSVRQLERGIQLSQGRELPADWTFLAMAHFRLGHHNESRRCLDRLGIDQRSEDLNKLSPLGQFWDEVEIRLLRREAQALVLYDPVFPADPFAR